MEFLFLPSILQTDCSTFLLKISFRLRLQLRLQVSNNFGSTGFDSGSATLRKTMGKKMFYIQNLYRYGTFAFPAQSLLQEPVLLLCFYLLNPDPHPPYSSGSSSKLPNYFLLKFWKFVCSRSFLKLSRSGFFLYATLLSWLFPTLISQRPWNSIQFQYPVQYRTLYHVGTLYHVQHPVSCTLYHVQHPVSCTLYHIHCTVSTLYHVPCTMCPVPSTLYYTAVDSCSVVPEPGEDGPVSLPSMTVTTYHLNNNKNQQNCKEHNGKFIK